MSESGGVSPNWKGSIKPHSARIHKNNDTPAPGAYNQSTSCGSQALSSKKSQSSYSFGKASRDEYMKSYLSKKHQAVMSNNQNPGPGNYEPSKSTGKQSDSRKKTQSQWSFDKAKRDAYETQFLTASHQAKMPSRTTKDVDYTPVESKSSCGKMALSTKRTSANYKFGTQKRDGPNNMYLSKEHQCKTVQLTTQNVGYTGKVNLLSESTASYKQSPQYGFGTGGRSGNTYHSKNLYS